jgi:hypothetical protein
MSTTATAGAATDHAPRFRLQLTAKRARRILIAIAALAVLLRVGSALFQGNAIETLPGVYDQVSYDGLARRVLQGFGFSFAEGHWPATAPGAPTAHWSYLYTLYLTAVYAVFGTTPVAARLLQAVAVGVLHTWLAWRVGRRVFGPVAGLLAALFSAVYIYFFYYAGALITESFYIVSLLWIFDVTLRIADQKLLPANDAKASRFSWLIWLELGLAVGTAVLLRQLVLLLIPLVYLWLWWQISRPQPSASSKGASTWRRLFGWKTLRGFVIAGVTTLAMILPWTIRNYQAFGTFVPLNTNAGYVFYWANHPIYGTEFVGILGGETGYADLLPPELLHLNEAELDRALLARGLEFVRDDPGRYVLLSLSRWREYFKFWPSSESSTISNLSRVGSFGLFLPFMLYGVVLAAIRGWRGRDRHFRAQLLLLYGFMLAYIAVHMLTWTLIRYRLPVDAVLLLFAAYGVVDLLQRFGLRVEIAPELATDA